MVITPPFGYDEIVPLRKQHRVLMPQGTTPEFCRHLNALAVSASEFVAAGRDYPIVFVGTDAGKAYAPVIVLGLAEASNLFIGPQGEWDPGVYLPAFVRRYPFCVSRSQVDGKPGGERVVCVLKSYLDDGGIALFDASGAPGPRWQSTERLLLEFENDLELTAQMCTALARMKLFEPFVMQAKNDDGSELTLQGMFRVDEARLRELRPASHKALVNMGHMGRIYAHLHSLDNFQRLYVRSRRR
ncbi:MAG: SapC family protein [Betaproteobacteria bacterium]|nr:SapC family protein [Betaproteobacteria bacterium]